MRCMPSRDETEHNSCGERNDQRESEHGAIELDGVGARDILRHGCDEGGGRPFRDE